MTILKTLFGWLLNRWFLSVLGFLCLTLAIWFFGPLVAIAGWSPLESIELRLLAILLVVFLWTMRNGGFRLLARLIGGFGKGAEPGVGDIPRAVPGAARAVRAIASRLGLVFRITAAVAGILLILGWTISFWHNNSYVAEMEISVQAYELLAGGLAEGSGSIVELLPPLDALRGLPGGYDDLDRAWPWWMGLGLSQREKLGGAARLAYRRTLNAALLPRVVQGLEEQLRSFQDQPELLFQALKAYLMIGNPPVLDAEFLTLWLSLDWNGRLPGAKNAAFRDNLDSHLAALFGGDLNPPALDGRLVSQTRAKLSAVPVAQRVYGDLRQEAQRSGLEEWRPGAVIGDVANRIFERRSGESLFKGIPGIFTRRGLTEFFFVRSPELVRWAVEESWVLGPEYNLRLGEMDPVSLIGEVNALYFADYIRVWESYLDDIDIVTFKSYGEAINVTNILSGPESPIKRLLNAIGEETALTKASVYEESEAMERLRNRVSRLLRTMPAGRETSLRDNPAAVVDASFKPLHDLVDTEGGPAPLDRVLDLVGRLNAQLRRAADAPGQDNRDIIGALRSESERTPQPLQNWLASLARQSAALTAGNVRQRLNTAWSGVASFCRQALDNRYPLVRNSSRDANFDDLARYFGPRGMVEDFFAKHLSPYVDTSVRPWKKRQADGPSLEIPSSTLRHFEQAHQIREALFPDRGARPAVRFQVRPIKLDASARHVLLEFGDQRLIYRHGPPRLLAMQWPPPGGALGAKIEIAPLVPLIGKQRAMSTKGPWSLFRLLDKGRVSRGGEKDRFRVAFKLGNLTASFEFRSGGAYNPFPLRALGEFRCLERL